MSKLIYPNWIDAYMQYTEDTESPDIYNKWVALSMLSTAIQKKIVLHVGRLRIHPNIYVVLVGPPGSRKSQAIDYGKELLKPLTKVKTNPSKCTTELLINRIANSKQREMINGKDTVHTSFSIISDEFETFLGYKGKNDGMIGFLTDIFSGGNPNFEYETISRGKDTLENPYISLLAATTPSSLSNSLPLGAVGGGLTSRILFPTARHKKGTIAFPSDMSNMKESLVHDLNLINRMTGEIKFSDEAKERWIHYYEKDPETHDASRRICTNPLFNYWYERRFLFIQKLAIISAVSRGEHKELAWSDIEYAMHLLGEVERGMDYAFSGVGESPLARKTSLVRDYVEEQKFLTESDILSVFWSDMPKRDLIEVIDTLEGIGLVRREWRREVDRSENNPKKNYIIWASAYNDWEYAKK